MAFTGTATQHQISDRLVRITGLTLAATSSGTFGLNGATGTAPDVRLPAAFQPEPYEYGGAVVSLQDSIQCTLRYTDSSGQPIICPIAKTGTTEANFRITVTNGSGSPTNAMEFYVEFH